MAEMLIVIERTLGPGRHIRDVGLLQGAVARPQAAMMGVEAYPDVHVKAAALLDSLVNSRPLIDGNKRVGLVATLMFLGLNGFGVVVSDDVLVEDVLRVAAGREDVHDLAKMLSRWTAP